jgi:hypothetical protein
LIDRGKKEKKGNFGVVVVVVVVFFFWPRFFSLFCSGFKD